MNLLLSSIFHIIQQKQRVMDGICNSSPPFKIQIDIIFEARDDLLCIFLKSLVFLAFFSGSHPLQTKNQTSTTWGLLHWRKWPGNILMLLLLPFYPFDESFCFELYVTYGCYLFRQIATAVGPCGNNRDYLFLLEKAMFDMGESFCQFSSSPSY